MLIFHFLKTSGSTISHLHQSLVKSFNEAAMAILRHFGESVLERNLYVGPLEIILRTLELGMTFR